MASYRPLEVTLISAKDLKNVNLMSKMEVYAIAWLSTDPQSKQRTTTDRDGGNDPSWNNNNATLRFSVPEGVDPSRLVLTILLRAERALGDRDVGEVHVPIKELQNSSSSSSGDGKNFVSYQVRRSSGRGKGVLNISYKFGDPVAAAAPSAPPPYPTAAPAGYPAPAVAAAPYPPPSAAAKSDEPVTAYPAPSSMAYTHPAAAGSPYPPAGYAGYPPSSYPPQQQQHGYAGYPPPPPQQGYGYPPPPYGYGVAPPVVQPQKKNKFGLGLGAGLLGGALGGLLIGDMISDSSYDAGFGDAGGFDF